MSSAESSFIELDNVGDIFDSVQTKPCHYFGSNGEDRLILLADGYEFPTDSTHGASGIYEYNIETGAVKKLDECDESKKFNINWASNIAHWFINESETLYIVNGDDKFVYTFNIKTKQSRSIKFDNWLEYPTLAYIPPPLNQLHIVSDYGHLKYCISTNKILTLEKPSDIDFIKAIYIPFKKQLMLLGCYASYGSDKILYQNVHQTDNKWHTYLLTMPHVIPDIDSYDCILQFETLLYVFYFHKGYDQENDIYDIWILDLMYDKWYKSKYTTPDSSSHTTFAIQWKDSVHMIDFCTGYHAKQSLHNLIPKELFDLYSKYYNSLVIGYIKEFECKLRIPAIPFVLKKLIWMYFPPFV